MGLPHVAGADAAAANGQATATAGPRTAHGPADLSAGDFPQIDANTTLLVVSPHPDDETLCCAGAIRRVLQAGGRAGVVWITSGDASELSMVIVEKSLFLNSSKLRDLAARRMREARAATALLGVPAEQQFFLGYPDRGVLQLMTDNYATPYHSRFTGATSVPYATAVFPGDPYTGQSLERDFDAVLDRVHPTLVLAPSPQDSHPDHRASGILAIRALSRRNELAKAHYWIVHGGEGWPSPRGYYPDIPLNPPPRGKGLAPTAFVLTEDEQMRKLDAVRAYRTQMEVMSSFLLAFVRTTELYSSIPVPAPAVSKK
ncbi:MAG: LmbE family protein [Gammaproteobacteria bacterium]|nr:LmbE family protein [Gammaproteobacteria bacterium]